MAENFVSIKMRHEQARWTTVPLMAMIRHRANSNNKVPAKLLYSSRSYKDIIYREELDHVSANDSSLRVIHALTRRQPQNWMSYRRRIDRAMLADTCLAAGGETAYVHLWSNSGGRERRH